MMKYTDLLFLGAPLPEDVEKLKWHGDLAHAARRIAQYLEGDIPQAQRSRLEAEKEVLSRLPDAYPLNWDAALERFKSAFEDATAEELEELADNGAVDWIWCEGERRFIANFVENLIKTRAAYSARAMGDFQKQVKENIANVECLDKVILSMKEKGSSRWRFTLRESFTLKKDREDGPGVVRVHLPLPVEYAQVESFTLLKTSEEPTFIAPATQSHRTIFFERPMKAGETIDVEFTYTIRNDYVQPDPAKVLNEQPTFYTEEQLPHIALTPYIRALAAEITGGEKNPLIRARRIYDYITTHLMYSFVRPYMAITDIPGYAASGWKGDCGIQALLFVTLCRAAGIPARWQSGLYSTPVVVGCHDWAQFYVEPYGWLFADCSFGGGAWRSGSTMRHDFYFGNLEPFRMPAASDFQQEFSPARKFPRNDPYDNQIGEAEYADRPMALDEFELKTELLKAEEL